LVEAQDIVSEAAHSREDARICSDARGVIATGEETPSNAFSTGL
jgi:hypothetical protein